MGVAPWSASAIIAEDAVLVLPSSLGAFGKEAVKTCIRRMSGAKVKGFNLPLGSACRRGEQGIDEHREPTERKDKGQEEHRNRDRAALLRETVDRGFRFP